MPKNKDEKNEVYLTEFQKQSLELVHGLNKWITTDELEKDCEELTKWITAVNAMTDDFSVKDEDGKLPVLDSLSIDAFRNAYINVLKACENIFFKYPSDDRDEAHKNIREATDKIRNVLIRDSMIFQRDDIEGLTLDQAIEKKLGKHAADHERTVFSTAEREGVSDADTVYVEFPEGTELNVIGNASERYPISFIDENGNRINGFFTQKQNIDHRENYDQITEKAVRKAKKDNVDPLWIEVIERTNTYRKDYTKDPENISWDNYDLAKLGYDDDTIRSLNEDKKFVDYYTDYLTKLSSFDIMAQVGYKRFGATYGSSIDKRNIAMSQVSKLLGKDDLLAESKNAQILIGDTIVEGTFMEEVKGYNASTFPEDHPAMELKSSVFDGSMALRDIADLDIMDYICQNIDRHTDNMIFKFSDDGRKCIGVIGIDNDLSFGTSRTDKTHSFDTNLKNIKLISEGMAQKIGSVSDTALRASLAKKGLSEREINESVRRLLEIRKRIQDGRIRVVKDDEWASMKLSDMEGERNYFGRVCDCFESEIQRKYYDGKDITFTEGKKVNSFGHQREHDYFLKDRVKNRGKSFADSLITVYEDAPADHGPIKSDDEMIELLNTWKETMKTGIKSGNSKLHGASKFYIDLNTKMDKFEKLVLDFRKGTFLSPGEYKAALKSLDELTQAADDYLEHVADVRKNDGRISKTQEKRSRLVKAVLDTAKSCRPIIDQNYKQLEAEYEKTRADLFSGLKDPEQNYLKEPAKTIYKKLKEIQGEVSPENMLGSLALEQQAAEIIFLAGIAKNINKLQEEEKLPLVVTADNIGKHVRIIKNSEAFKQMLESTSKEELIRMAKGGDAKELFDHYSKLLYETERKVRTNTAKQTVKTEVKPQVIKNNNLYKDQKGPG